MLSYSLDGARKTPLYEQLYSHIKKDIIGGVLRENERLPSKRSLAKNLCVSVITVENAYANLLAEGYIYSLPKSGYYVSRIEAPPAAPSVGENGRPIAPPERVLRADMRSNGADASLFPLAQWSRITRKVLADGDASLFSAEGHAGDRILRQAIASYLSENRALSVSPDNIIIGAGTEYLCTLLVQLLGSYRVFGLENPCYRKVPALYAAGGARCFFLGLDDSGVDMDELRKSPVEVLHISPNHQYPTGIVADAVRRFELLSWAGEREGRYIIEDDYDSELRFDARPYPSMRGEDIGGRVIYMNTFSKTISPSFRVGFLVLPDALMKLYAERFGMFSCTVSSIDQLILAEFIRSGQYERHLNRLKRLYRMRRERFLSMIDESALAGSLRVAEGRAGLHFLLELPTDMPDAEVRALAEQNGIGLSFLSDHLHAPIPRLAHKLVVNYSGFDEAGFGEVLSFLETVLKQPESSAP